MHLEGYSFINLFFGNLAYIVTCATHFNKHILCCFETAGHISEKIQLMLLNDLDKY